MPSVARGSIAEVPHAPSIDLVARRTIDQA
jgi:hypothetical protein